jgi:hypothetical protein
MFIVVLLSELKSRTRVLCSNGLLLDISVDQAMTATACATLGWASGRFALVHACTQGNGVGATQHTWGLLSWQAPYTYGPTDTLMHELLSQHTSLLTFEMSDTADRPIYVASCLSTSQKPTS